MSPLVLLHEGMGDAWVDNWAVDGEVSGGEGVVEGPVCVCVCVSVWRGGYVCQVGDKYAKYSMRYVGAYVFAESNGVYVYANK